MAETPVVQSGESATASSCALAPVTLTREQRERVLSQIELILKNHYVHLRQKENLYGVNPWPCLKRLRADVRSENEEMTEIQFSRRVTDLLRSMRDRHLDYVLPFAEENCVAYVPFLIAEIEEAGARKYLVSAVVQNASSLPLGAEIVSWNGIPIRDALARHAERQPGCGDEAQRALAVRSLPMRLLQYDGPPEEDEVPVEYLTREGERRRQTLQWEIAKVSEVQAGLSVPTTERWAPRPRSRFPTPDVDPRLDLLNFTRRCMYPRALVTLKAADGTQEGSAEPSTFEEDATLSPGDQEWLVARYYRNREHPVGYIRIREFPKDPTACQPLNAFAALLRRFQNEMPTEGLVVDIRNNPGGSIQVAAYMLQMLTDKTIQPPRMELRNTKANLKYCTNVIAGQKFKLERWVPLLEEGIAAGQDFSEPLDMPARDECALAPLQQIYRGPVVLITNALTYSAADVFAAGFQDHAVGPILGVHSQTGGGGANVMNHKQVEDLGSGYRELPENAALTFPLLRIRRRGAHEGQILEDHGVRIDADNVQPLTRNDIMRQEVDLVLRAAALIGL